MNIKNTVRDQLEPQHRAVYKSVALGYKVNLVKHVRSHGSNLITIVIQQLVTSLVNELVSLICSYLVSC